MTDLSAAETPEVTDLDRQHCRTLIKFGVLAFILCLVVGAIGGYLVLDANAGKSIPFVVIFAPALVTLALVAIPLYIVRKRWFPNQDVLIAAAKSLHPKD